MRKGQKLPLRLSSTGHRLHDYLLYLWAQSRAKKRGAGIHPSNTHLATKLKCSVRTVIRQMQRLERLRLVKSWKQLPFRACNKWLPRQRFCGSLGWGRLRDKIAALAKRTGLKIPAPRRGKSPYKHLPMTDAQKAVLARLKAEVA